MNIGLPNTIDMIENNTFNLFQQQNERLDMRSKSDVVSPQHNHDNINNLQNLSIASDIIYNNNNHYDNYKNKNNTIFSAQLIANCIDDIPSDVMYTCQLPRLKQAFESELQTYFSRRLWKKILDLCKWKGFGHKNASGFYEKNQQKQKQNNQIDKKSFNIPVKKINKLSKVKQTLPIKQQHHTNNKNQKNVLHIKTNSHTDKDSKILLQNMMNICDVLKQNISDFYMKQIH
jgi:hypothetical protein